MPRLFFSALAAVLLSGAFAPLEAGRAAGEVTIYRCLFSGGKVSLQDHPCPKNSHQDVREMIRPTDPLPQLQARVKTAARSNQPALEIRIVHERDPQPLYECHSFDGQTYLSRTGISEQRWGGLR